MNESGQPRDRFSGANAGYVLALFEQYSTDKDSVDTATRAYFDAHAGEFLAEIAQRGPQPPVHEAVGVDAGAAVTLGAAAARLARFIRQRGHLEADVDPLRLRPRFDAELALGEHGLTESNLFSLPSSVVGGPIAKITSNALDAINRLRQLYSGPIGFDDEHIQNKAERHWLRNAAESGRFFENMNADWKREILIRLTEVDSFERFIDKTWPKEKRFSIEGSDMMVPMLDEIIRSSVDKNVREVVLAMAHRGRLNVLAHVLRKPYSAIFAAFDDKNRPRDSVSLDGSSGYTGDVKYHLGYRLAYRREDREESDSAVVPIALVPNPSHLEFVNPVAVGHARAAQEAGSSAGASKRDDKASLAILIHGDAAFPGQGVVAETLNLSQLRGYSTGGTIHIIANNQIGFTTDPEDGRSTEYASDLAKGFEIPIVHVNADDPAACIAAARMACEYRENFHKDFLIDLVGYRRYGHNEGDNPAFTQPVMYQAVDSHPRVREIWAKRLAEEGVVGSGESERVAEDVWATLSAAKVAPAPSSTGGHEADEERLSVPQEPPVLSSAELLQLNSELLLRPEWFTGDPKLERRVLQSREKSISEPAGITWGHAEELAFAVTLAEGTAIRLTGQDCERGTFGHRNAVLHDMNSGKTYTPLQHIPSARAPFSVYNSPLSENAAMGFEYGYSVHSPNTLTLWEGQFGDFANGAQVIIDQFLASGVAKWQEYSSLVLLLPHGYEGQGPEHSSARIERYLQLTANDNLSVCNCTTSAQFFHLLRRQVASLKSRPKPLVVLTPKSLLRHNRASCSLVDLTQGEFQPVIDDSEAIKRAARVTRLILCSGKIYMDMVYSPTSPYDPRPEFAQAESVALVRVEELYPFPSASLQQVISGYPNLREIVWMQEEPRNMGAWSFVEPRLRALIGCDGSLHYVGRAEAASPAEGSIAQHLAEQSRILCTALDSPPASSLNLTPDSSDETNQRTMEMGAEVESWGLGARRAN